MSEKKGQKDDGGYWLDDREYIMPDVKSRQSVKHEPVVTREEIGGLMEALKSLIPGLCQREHIVSWLKSKGVEVRDDKNQS